MSKFVDNICLIFCSANNIPKGDFYSSRCKCKIRNDVPSIGSVLDLLGVLLEMVYKEASRAFAAYGIIAMSTILMTLSIYVHKYD